MLNTLGTIFRRLNSLPTIVIQQMIMYSIFFRRIRFLEAIKLEGQKADTLKRNILRIVTSAMLRLSNSILTIIISYRVVLASRSIWSIVSLWNFFLLRQSNAIVVSDDVFKGNMLEIILYTFFLSKHFCFQ